MNTIHEKNNNLQENQPKDGEIFAEAITSAESGEPLYLKLARHFADEMYKAIEGRICTPERMAKLYPIFREINQETDEIKKYWRDFEVKAKRKDGKKAAKNKNL